MPYHTSWTSVGPRYVEEVAKSPLEAQNLNTWVHKANKGKYMMFSMARAAPSHVRGKREEESFASVQGMKSSSHKRGLGGAEGR